MAVTTNKDHPENTAAGQKAKAGAIQADKSSAEVQAKVDEAEAQGFRGIEVDPTPNENYSVAGVTSAAPTPETDDDAAEKARQAQADIARRANGVAER